MKFVKLSKQVLTIACIAALSFGCYRHRTTEQPGAIVDPFIGRWKLVSSNNVMGIENELITVNLTSGGLKFTYDGIRLHGPEFHFWIVTDGNGAPVNLTSADGKQMSDVWRMTRQNRNLLSVDSYLGSRVLEESKYSVSTDGSTLKIEKVTGKSGLIGGGPTLTGSEVLVFEKSP